MLNRDDRCLKMVALLGCCLTSTQVCPVVAGQCSLTGEDDCCLNLASHLVLGCCWLLTHQRRCSVDPGILDPGLAAPLVVPQPAAVAAAVLAAAAAADGW